MKTWRAKKDKLGFYMPGKYQSTWVMSQTLMQTLSYPLSLSELQRADAAHMISDGDIKITDTGAGVWS